MTTEGESYEDCVADRKGCEKTFRYRLARLETLLGGRGRLLDLGCGRGFFMSVAQARGWDVYGIDVAEDQVKHAAEPFGLEARATTLAGAGFAEGFFDAAILNNTFERLPDPAAELQEIYRVLRPRGVVMLVTDNPRRSRPELRSMLEAAGFVGAFVKLEGTYSSVDFLVTQTAKGQPAAGALASIARAVHLGQVLLPVWTGHKVAACGYKPRNTAPVEQLSS